MGRRKLDKIWAQCIFTKKFCFANLKLGSVTVIFTITKKIRNYILLCRCLFPCVESNNYWAQNTHSKQRYINFWKKCLQWQYIWYPHKLDRNVFNDIFLDLVKIMGKGWKLLSLRQVWRNFFSQGLSYYDIVSTTFLVIFIYKNNCH